MVNFINSALHTGVEVGWSYTVTSCLNRQLTLRSLHTRNSTHATRWANSYKHCIGLLLQQKKYSIQYTCINKKDEQTYINLKIGRFQHVNHVKTAVHKIAKLSNENKLWATHLSKSFQLFIYRLVKEFERFVWCFKVWHKPTSSNL